MIDINMKCKGIVIGQVTSYICPYAWNCYRYKAYQDKVRSTRIPVAYDEVKRTCTEYKPIKNYSHGN